MHMGQPRRAIADLDKAIRLNSYERLRPHKHRGNAYIELGDRERGMRDLAQYERMGGDNWRETIS